MKMEIYFINMLLHFYHTIIVLYKDFVLCLYFKINLSNWVSVAELELQKNVLCQQNICMIVVINII